MDLCVPLHELFQVVMVDMGIHSEELLEHDLHNVHEVFWVDSIAMGIERKKAYGIRANSLLLNTSAIQMNTLLM